jgi:hypothetical protein
MEKKLLELFQEWQDLNKQVEEMFGQFDFSSIKKIRENQRKLEDSIYLILLGNTSEDIKKILPETCGELEIGFDVKNNIFYYVMLDPDYEESEETKLIAITIDSKKNVNLVKDFIAD